MRYEDAVYGTVEISEPVLLKSRPKANWGSPLRSR